MTAPKGGAINDVVEPPKLLRFTLSFRGDKLDTSLIELVFPATRGGDLAARSPESNARFSIHDVREESAEPPWWS